MVGKSRGRVSMRPKQAKPEVGFDPAAPGADLTVILRPSRPEASQNEEGATPDEPSPYGWRVGPTSESAFTNVTDASRSLAQAMSALAAAATPRATIRDAARALRNTAARPEDIRATEQIISQYLTALTRPIESLVVHTDSERLRHNDRASFTGRMDMFVRQDRSVESRVRLPDGNGAAARAGLALTAGIMGAHGVPLRVATDIQGRCSNISEVQLILLENEAYLCMMTYVEGRAGCNVHIYDDAGTWLTSRSAPVGLGPRGTMLRALSEVLWRNG